MMALAVVGLRVAFAFPLEPRANPRIFQQSE